jgi:alpha-galactosidase
VLGGYQSWDPADQTGVAAIARDGQAGTRESWWTVGLADDAGAGLAGVAAGAAVSRTRFAVTGSELTLAWCQPGVRDEPLPLFTGGSAVEWESDPVLLAPGPDVRRRLSALLGSAEGPGRARTPAVPRGWLSWYHLGPWVHRQDVLDHSELLAREPWSGLGYRVVVVDDGWEEAYGDWVPNSKFRGGFRPIADVLAHRGQTLGVWTAPFLVSAASDLARRAPDGWFVLESATGERVVDPRQVVFGPMQVLDASHPDVRAHLKDTFRRLRDEGIRYFKIDFLYAGAFGGITALRAGVEAIREGVGDAYLLASGAPLLPVADLVDGCRIGPDTATPWYDFEGGGARPTVFTDEVIAVARNTAALTHWAARFQIDPDVALVGGNLDLEQGRQLVTVVALAGGLFFASDDLRHLPPERKALLTNPEVLSLAGGPPAIPDWEPGEVGRPSSHWRREDVLAVFNWTPSGRGVRVRAPGARGARDLWERRELPDFRDGSVLEIPPQGVRLVRVRTR